VDALIAPAGGLEILSRSEVADLLDAGGGGLYELWRRCSLAVLNAGTEDDDIGRILHRHQDFDISIVQREGGIALELENAPDRAFVDGQMIRGVRQHLFAVLRDLLYTHQAVQTGNRFDLHTSQGITDAVFHILRNARVLRVDAPPRVVVCWGGHAISRHEYDYTKSVGYALGLRELDVCTGCGAGAMKGPMKGAALGHAKQRLVDGRYLGLTEPTIIAAEAPNPLVKELVILPDMEKRLEAFLRVAHAIIVFPGGVGTAEEILYLLGVLLHPDNRSLELPVIFTGPGSSRDYFERLHAFIGSTLGTEAQQLYKVIVDAPDTVAREVAQGMSLVQRSRERLDDAYFFNWQMRIDEAFQRPFEATHQSMAELPLQRDLPPEHLAVNLRRAFSGIVAGNVREAGVRLVQQLGPFELRGDSSIVAALDQLLKDFVRERRMRLSDPANYVPCFRFAA
jgi:pyrimidine/purine-5'-nucleotide nucleosidase